MEETVIFYAFAEIAVESLEVMSRTCPPPTTTTSKPSRPRAILPLAASFGNRLGKMFIAFLSVAFLAIFLNYIHLICLALHFLLVTVLLFSQILKFRWFHFPIMVRTVSMFPLRLVIGIRELKVLLYQSNFFQGFLLKQPV